MATDGLDFVRDEEEDEDATKCMCMSCGRGINSAETLQCQKCRCYFCSSSCAQAYEACDGGLHC
jgi:hypothetical protein